MNDRFACRECENGTLPLDADDDGYHCCSQCWSSVHTGSVYMQRVREGLDPLRQRTPNPSRAMWNAMGRDAPFPAREVDSRWRH